MDPGIVVLGWIAVICGVFDESAFEENRFEK
jgi:hypothetical protein